MASLVVAIAALVVSLFAVGVQRSALRVQREALPVSAKFKLSTNVWMGDDGVRWVWGSMENTGARIYVHDIFPLDWKPDDLDVDLAPNLARVGMPESWPPGLKHASRKVVRNSVGVFKPGYMRTHSFHGYRVSCPAGVEKIRFTATVSLAKRGAKRFIISDFIAVPSRDASE